MRVSFPWNSDLCLVDCRLRALAQLLADDAPTEPIGTLAASRSSSGYRSSRQGLVLSQILEDDPRPSHG